VIYSVDWRDQQRVHFDRSQRGHAKSCPQSRLRLNVFANHRPPTSASGSKSRCSMPWPHPRNPRSHRASKLPPRLSGPLPTPAQDPAKNLGLPREPTSDVPAIGPASRSGVAQPPPRMTCAPSSTSRRFLGRSLLLDWIEITEWSVRPQGQPRHTVDDDKKGGCRFVPRLLIDPLPLRLARCDVRVRVRCGDPDVRCIKHKAGALPMYGACQTCIRVLPGPALQFSSARLHTYRYLRQIKQRWRATALSRRSR
jgi:hypothetical protein